MLTFPQWPLVVTATMSQFPSNCAAFAGGAEQMIAKAVDRAKARIRLLIMGGPHTSIYLRGRFAQRARNVLMEQCTEFQGDIKGDTFADFEIKVSLGTMVKSDFLL